MEEFQCKNKDSFCFVCGHFTHQKSRRHISRSLEDPYFLYFGIRYTSQPWIPNIICTTCESALLSWFKASRRALSIVSPMTWMEPMQHLAETCYFCKNFKIGRNKKQYSNMKYQSTCNVILPEMREKGIPPPASPQEILVTSNLGQAVTDIETFGVTSDEDYTPSFIPNKWPKLIDKTYFDDLVRDLELTMTKSEVLSSRLKERNLLTDDVKVTFSRKRHSDVELYFKKSEELVYCENIEAIMNYLGIPIDNTSWRLFIDSSMLSLKAVLLHNGNLYPAIPIGYSTKKEETYSNLLHLLDKIQYSKYMWEVCADFKVIAVLTGLQSGYTKYMCFLCKWDTRAKETHYHVKHFEPREESIMGKFNLVHAPLVPKEKIILPPLHIKLGIVKNFIKSLNTQEPAFNRIMQLFPRLSTAKIKEGMLVGPDIRKLMNDSVFYEHLSDMQKTAFDLMVLVVTEFLGNHRADNYEENVENMLTAFNNINVKMSLKLHFLHSHLQFFKENLGAVSDEHGERFHQEIKLIEERFKGKSQSAMLAEYVWGLHRNIDISEHSRLPKYKRIH